MKNGSLSNKAIILALVLGAYGLGADLEAKEATYIAVGKAKTKKSILAFPMVISGDPSSQTKQLAEVLTRTVTTDLIFMDLFRFISPTLFKDRSNAIKPSGFRFADWTKIGADLVIKAAVSQEGKNLAFEAYLYDPQRGKQIIGKRYLAKQDEVNTVGHTFANHIVEALTGLPGIFLTKIAMSCNRTKNKEIYFMDFNGSSVMQATHHRSIAFAPAWSPDGTKLAYSLVNRHRNNIKNIDLFEFNFLKNTVRMISNRRGINSGAAYSPDGKSILLTMSFMGNPEIFKLDPSNRKVTRMTDSFGFDVDPAWAPDGNSFAFVSSRSGKPMVHTMQSNGTIAKRLTFAGRYNATPSWSPQNNKIAFAGWKDGKFDIFIMNPDGTKIERLTKNQGNNEDPSFSPDGNFIVFSSNRSGAKNIYVMNIDGTFVKRLTYGLGDCVAPKWSAPPK